MAMFISLFVCLPEGRPFGFVWKIGTQRSTFSGHYSPVCQAHDIIHYVHVRSTILHTHTEKNTYIYIYTYICTHTVYDTYIYIYIHIIIE